MEYLAGESLSRVMKRLAQSSSAEAVAKSPFLAARIIAAAAEGLHAAHELTNEQGQPLDVVHRDVSPQNIFVTYDGAVKVVDFGVARARERLEHTRAGDFKGKFEYVAPEQLKSKGYDRRVDLWALGVCLWELLTLRHLFRCDEVAATIAAVATEEIEPPSHYNRAVPTELDAIVLKALQRDPARRFQTGREFSRALREFLSRQGQLIDDPEIAEWMTELFPQEKARRLGMVAQASAAPELDVEEKPGSVPSQFNVSDSASASLPGVALASEPGSGRGLYIALAALVAVALGAGGYLLGGRGHDGEPPSAAVEPPPAVAPPTPPKPRPVEAQAPVAEDAGSGEVAVTPVDAGVVEAVVAPPPPVDAGVVEVAVAPPAPEAPVVKVASPSPSPRPRPAPEKPLVKPVAVAPTPVEPPAPVTPAAHVGNAGTGVVHVLSHDALEVFVDGERKGVTPLHLELNVGEHRLELHMAGVPNPVAQQSIHVALASEYTIRAD
jgi:serine/threonine-protein kinase